MSILGTDKCPLRVGIIGAGPSGFYVADALFRSKIPVVVDVFDRLPTPYGLLRGGVAPDHQQMKTVGKYYEKVATTPGFSFWGNVKVGRDIQIDELAKHYDVLVLTCGAETDKKLNIAGEELPGSHTATAFVGWYNAHPDYQSCQFDFNQEIVAVIGQGNVAIDVTRILAKNRKELSSSDITEHALSVLEASKIKEIHLIGRRGPVQAAFTELEIKELGELEDCDVVVNPKDLELDTASREELENPANNKARKNMAILEEFSRRPLQHKPKKIVIRFLESPSCIQGENKVEALVLTKNKLVGEAYSQQAMATEDQVHLSCGLIFRSVGYRGVPLEGVPFDTKRGVFPNIKGRIQKDGAPVQGLYCSGWIKRGPSGVLGSNKSDATETVQALVEDIAMMTPCTQRDSTALKTLLEKRGVRIITFDEWKTIDVEEVSRGKDLGKPREKFRYIEEIISFLDSH